jgi:hypothetical protein
VPTDKTNQNAYTILANKPEGKRPPTRLRFRWKNIKMDLKFVWEDVDYIHTSQWEALRGLNMQAS